MISGYIRGQTLTLAQTVIAADTINYLTARFSFQTSDWDGLTKIAHFSNGTDAADVELTDDEILAEDGLNLTEGQWQVSVTGHEMSGGELVKRITTTIAKLTVRPSGVPDGEPVPSLPSYGEQILAEVEDIRETLGAFTAEAETLAPGSDATALYDPETGVFSFGLPRGDKGDPGREGDPGDDGFSPTATVTKSGKTATITITDKDGTTTASVTDGEDGDPGDDGFSPVATVTKSGKVATISITDANGTTTAQISDGQDGADGQDGVTPSFSIGTVETGEAGTDASATITGTDAEPVLNLTIPRGDPGEVTEDELADALLDKADVIVDSASGAVASFPDGAATPAKSLVVGIEPVQDLHGYDNPWPAGGGKNMLSSQDGTYVEKESGNLLITQSGGMSLAAGTYYVGAYRKNNTSNSCGIYQKVNGGTASRLGSNSGNQYIARSFTLEEAATVELYVYSGTDTGNEFRFMLTTSVLTDNQNQFEPYSNVCPITGHTAARVTRTGKNLLSTKLYTGLSYNPAVGTVANFAESADQFTTTDHETFTITFASTWQVRAMYCSVKPGQTYRFKRYAASTTLATTRGFLDRNFAVISTYNITDATQNTEDTIIAPSNAAYFFFLITNRSTANDTVTVKYPQLELGSTATSYAPYAGQVYDITFPSEAGTVYGGSLDAVSGVLMADRAMVDLGTLTWSSWPQGGSMIFYASVSGKKPTRIDPCLCSIYEYNATMVGSWDDLHDKQVTGQVDGTNVYVRDTSYSDNASFKTAMSGVQLVYELATPLTYQLTPTEVETLLGTNNIWADTGDTACQYRASTKLYIDKKLAALAAQIVNS